MSKIIENTEALTALVPLTNRLIDDLLDQFMSDARVNEQCHNYAFYRLGMEPRGMTDEDENAPWYDSYWNYVVSYQTALIHGILGKVANTELVTNPPFQR